MVMDTICFAGNRANAIHSNGADTPPSERPARRLKPEDDND